MKINRSNRLLRGLLITAAVAPSLAFAQVDPSNPSNNILGDDVLLGNVIDDPTNADPLVLIVDPALQVDVQVTGQTLLNGTLTVQPLVTTVVTPGVPVAVGGVPTSNGVIDPVGTGGPTITAETLIDRTTDSQVVTGGGGATIETNGDTTLTSDTSTTTTVSYGRRVTFEIAQTGNANPVGDPIDNTEIYYLTNSAGDIVGGAPTFRADSYLADPDPAASARAALDAYIASLTPGDIYTLDPTLGTEVTAGSGGGNLVVEGTTFAGGTTAQRDAWVAAQAANQATVTTQEAIIVAQQAIIADPLSTPGQITAAQDAIAAAEAVIVVAERALDTDFIASGNVQVNGAVLDENGENLIGLQADGTIHIGANSLITNQTGDVAGVGGVQELYAGDINGDPIDLVIASGSNLVVNNNLSVSGTTATTGLTNTGAVTTDTLTVNGASTLSGFVTSAGIDNNGSLETETLDVNGASNFDGLVTSNAIDNAGNLETETLDVNGASNLDGLVTAGALNVIGATDLDGTLNVDGATTTAGITNTGTFQNNGNATITGTLVVNGNISDADSAVTVDDDLAVTGNTQLDGDLNVDGVTTLDETTVDGTLDVTGDTDLDGNLNVDGTISTAGVGAVVVDDSLQVTGNADVDGNLNVDGNAQIDGTLNVDGNTDIDGSLNVDGLTTTAGLTNNGTFQNNGSATITGALTVNGNISDANSDVTIADGLNVTGNTDLDGSLNVDGNTTLTNVTASGTLAVNGNTTLGNAITDATTINGTLAVSGLASTNGISNNGNITTSTLDVTGNASVGGSLDMTNGQIRNLANGTIASDAVNLGQMQAADNVLRNDFERADRGLQNQIDSNSHQIDQNTRGIAMVAAMTNTTIQPGMKQAIDFNLAQYEGETGFAFGYGYRVNEHLQLNAAGASTTDFEESVVRLGLSYQW